MLLPSTHTAALLLLVLSFLCLGSWANLLKVSGGRWRFELFNFDFAVGGILFALLAAYTLGTLGSELSFTDRTVVAGLRSQALAIAGGVIFGLGNMLLLATIALIGYAASFPLVVGVALLVASSTTLHGVNVYLLGVGAALCLVASISAFLSCRQAPAKLQSGRRSNAPIPVRASTKAALTGIPAGLLLGGSYPLAAGAFWGDLGLGAYAGLLMFAIGLVLATAVFNLFFLNIGLNGPRLSLRSYVAGTVRNHAAGIVAGVLWGMGTLAYLLAQSVPFTEQPSYASLLLWTQGSALLAALWGVLVWRDSGKPVQTTVALAALAAGIGALAFRIRL